LIVELGSRQLEEEINMDFIGSDILDIGRSQSRYEEDSFTNVVSEAPGFERFMLPSVAKVSPLCLRLSSCIDRASYLSSESWFGLLCMA
jgi:hypothetical protein